MQKPARTTPEIVVLGSLNMDLVMRAARCPLPGETLMAHDFATHPGGKGANQAVACARMGARVAMIGKLGHDAFGKTLRHGLTQDGIDHSQVTTADGASGMAIILVEDQGQNRILLAPGANSQLEVRDIHEAHSLISQAALFICQLEVPLACVLHAQALARQHQVPILFNPAPAITLPPELLASDYLVLNEPEAALVTGLAVDNLDQAQQAARRLHQLGAGLVLLTLGAQGVIVCDQTGCRHQSALATTAIDTTAAGDTFIGAFAAALTSGMTADAAVERALKAAALCVSRVGAQPSIPYQHELA